MLAFNTSSCAATTGSLPTNYSTIGCHFVPIKVANECPGKCDHFQTIFMDGGVSMEELRVEDYRLDGRPPSYPSEPAFCGVSLAPEKHGLFDIQVSHDIKESHFPPPHSNDLWYDDGSVVLKAGDKLFRVHRSFLSQKSSVFAAVLPKSQAESTETHDGCPLFALDDDAEEFRQLLLTIYEISYFEDNVRYLTYLRALIRLGTKYQMKTLRDLALERLKRGVPSTLASFDVPEHQKDRANAQQDVLAIINLAREINCLELLPCAYYYCSRLSTSTIFKGSDGVVLASPDITACILGKDQLLDMQRRTTHSFLYTLPKLNKSCGQGCGENDRCLLQYLQHQDFTTPSTFELFTDWEKIGVCKDCAPSHQSRHMKGRQDAWEQLPKIFGLESWKKIVV